MYAILVSVENEGDFITTFRKTAKRISCKLLILKEIKKEFKIMKKTKKQKGCRKYDFVTVKV